MSDVTKDIFRLIEYNHKEYVRMSKQAEKEAEGKSLAKTSVFWTSTAVFHCGYCGGRIDPPRLGYGEWGYWLDLVLDKDGQPVAALHEHCAGYAERGEPLGFEDAAKEFQNVYANTENV